MKRDAGVTSTSSSPFARLRDIPIQAVTLGEGIWKTRFRTNADTSIPAFFELLEKAGAIDKLRGRKNKARGNSDADLAKWIEAASFVLQSEENKQLEDLLQRVVSYISAS
ncbi:MAG: beta-L-arabinofuranosidase domain-containing protein, partial [Planctomycetota bacterium]